MALIGGKVTKKKGYHCACPGSPPNVPPYIIAVPPSGTCEGACQGGVKKPDARIGMGNRRRRYSNMSGMDSNGSMSVGEYAVSLLSVGVLFFVIGYGYYKGKESA